MGVVWPSALLFDRVVSGDYPAIIDGTGEIWSAVTGVIPTIFDQAGVVGGGDDSPGADFAATGVVYGLYGDCAWFDRIHVAPDLIALGNLLSTQTRQIEIFNSFGGDKDYTAFVNNINGAGVTILNQPMLPATIGTFNSIVLNVQISSVGPPVISGTLDFTVDGGLFLVELTGGRVVVFPVRPSNPVIREVLEFSTDILPAKDGTEQRIRIRDYPRQRIALDFFEFDDEAANIRNLLFDWMPRVWGVPIWWEERQLGADAAVDDLTVTVDTTFADFRVGAAAIIFEDQFNFEAIEIASLTASSLTFTSGLLRPHLAKDTTVLPLRTAYANTKGPSEKHMLQGQMKLSMDFITLDNIDLADASAFPTYKGQVLLDEPNLVRGSNISEGWSREVAKLDPIAGPPFQVATNDRSRLATRKSFFSATPQRLWEVRQLMHFFGGSVEPFYLPSFRPDMRVISTIGASSVTFSIRNIGFTDFVMERQPFQNLRLLLNDGTAFVREIVSSLVIDSDEETITVDTSFSGSPIPVTDIKRIELVALVRVRKDRVTFEHTAPGYAGISMEVVTVQFDPA